MDAAVQADAAAGPGDRRVELGGGAVQIERGLDSAAPAILDGKRKTEDADDAVAVDADDLAAVACDDLRRPLAQPFEQRAEDFGLHRRREQIGRASCRERVRQYV